MKKYIVALSVLILIGIVDKAEAILFSPCTVFEPTCVACYCVSKFSGRVRLVECGLITAGLETGPLCEVKAARCHRWERPLYNPSPGLEADITVPENNVSVPGSVAPNCRKLFATTICTTLPAFAPCGINE